jgi:hypothetical protein
VEGNDVEITWLVRERDVSESTWVAVYMASGAQFHRHADGCDGSVTFLYRVDPTNLAGVGAES